jgi:S-(hydroxymethyl)glutathione dehydrogenase/alcohol dehydrogenase
MKTEAVVLRDVTRTPEVEELELPVLAAGQALVEVAYSGVCHTQLLEVRGRRGADPHLPHMLGHEGSGIVREIGPGVRKVRPGQRVVLSWIKGSGQEVPCTTYRGTRGNVNCGALSTFSRWALVSENRLTPLPPGVPLAQAALLGCAVPTGAGVILNTLAVQTGATIVIFGVGGIGLCALMAARIVGARVIVAVDVVPEKLTLAKVLGATHTLDARHDDAEERLRELSGGSGFDYAVEAAGRLDTMQAAITAVRPGGGRVALAGNPTSGQRLELDPFELIRGKTIQGTWGGETNPDRDIPRYAALARAGRLPLARLITHRYTLEHTAQALDDLEAGRVGRALIDMSAASDTTPVVSAISSDTAPMDPAIAMENSGQLLPGAAVGPSRPVTLTASQGRTSG